MPPASGIRPIRTKAWVKFAERAAMMMSPASARFIPAPAATPFTALTIGFGQLRIASTSGL